MESKFKGLDKIVLGLVMLIVGGTSAYHSYNHTEMDEQTKVKVEKLETLLQDKRLDEIVMKTADGKEITRIKLYDEVAAIVVKSIQQQQEAKK